ncbi:hypothetical protein [uncultured Zobellia sp.]|uniref:hypothetical protein n=1 Tax=uncultured Zobellia sp. TaxID=255433 RepID=UPI002591D5C8|nr:hypothetical protein [uncultured Zobellia sp.]
MEKKEPSVQIILAENLSIKDREIAMRYWKQNHGVFEKPSKIARDYNLRTVEITRIGRKVGFLKISKACKKCHIQRQYKTDSQAQAKRILAPLWICDVCKSKQQKEKEEPNGPMVDFLEKELKGLSITDNKDALISGEHSKQPCDLQLISELENALKTNLRVLELLKRALITNSTPDNNEMILELKKNQDIEYIDEPTYSGEIIFADDITFKANTKYYYNAYLLIGDDLRFHLFSKK